MTSRWDITLEEVVRIKEECWAEVSHLPFEGAMEERLRQCKETMKELGLEYLEVGPDQVFGHFRLNIGEPHVTRSPRHRNSR